MEKFDMKIPNLKPVVIRNDQPASSEDKPKGTGMSRREFIGAMGASLGGACLLGTLNASPVFAESTAQQNAILYDSTKCIACHACEYACKDVNQLKGDPSSDAGLVANTWLKVTSTEVTVNGKTSVIHTRLACRHCGACVKVCPSKALTQRDDGIVLMNPNKCIGCRYCFEACPFNIPRYGDDGAMRKCILCSGRVDKREKPGCVQVCPVEALTFGPRANIVISGRERVQALITEGYSNAYLYGDAELGGTPLMYVLGYSPEVYKFPQLPLEPKEPMTLKDLAIPLGGILGLSLVAIWGFKYIQGRKIKQAKGTSSQK
jgi:formate dehydrogenase iron-sulfur subunit